MHLLFAFGLYAIGYLFWSRLVERNLKVDCVRPTPAFSRYDGVDFVPTKPAILFGHHFASIAGVGPIVGPILALKFGWLPVLLWLVLGVVFIGAVHDFASVLVSTRHGGESIGRILRDYLGRWVGVAYWIFTLFAVFLVIAVFTRIVAKSFELNPPAASASIFITVFSILIGVFARRFSLPQGVVALFAFISAFLSVLLGMKFPLHLSYQTWIYILVIYMFFASWIPVWVLLQPRDFTNFFILLSFILGGVSGILLGGVKLQMPAIGDTKDLVLLFPMLFVTVACGSVSGFHSLVGSGTTSKQLSSECHARPIGYGGMLMESLLGVISLTALAIFTPDEYIRLIGEKGDKVINAFGVGMATIVSKLGVDFDFAKNFAVLALGAFALTSLDTAVRIARYISEELLGAMGGGKLKPAHKVGVSAGVVAVSMAVLASGGASLLWPLFGASNQLLAGLALVTVTVWATYLGVRRFYFAVPAVFMIVVTLSAFAVQMWEFVVSGRFVLVFISLVLVANAVFIVSNAFRFLVLSEVRVSKVREADNKKF